MADQAGSGIVTGFPQDSGALSRDTTDLPVGEPFHGRAVSWVAVAIVMGGFVIGGLALVFGPIWWLFWAGAGVSAVGGMLALGTGIFNDWY